MKPLIYLAYRQFINNIRNMFTSPKRLIPAIFVLLWVGQAFLPILLHGLNPVPVNTPPILNINTLQLDVIWSTVFMLLTLITLWTIYSALSEGLLIFSPAHIDFMFPTPIHRRAVLFLKLLGDYIKYAIFVALFFLLVIPQLYIFTGITSGLSIAVSALGVLLLLILTMNVTHTLNILVSAGIRRLQFASKLVKLTILVVVGAFLVTGVMNYIETGDIAYSFVALGHSVIAQYILLPVSWCADVVVSPISGKTASIGFELLSLFGLAVLSFVVLLARPENFYEPSLGISTKYAKRIAAIRTGNSRALRLEARKEKGKKIYVSSVIPPFGTGVWALLWKDLVVRVRMMRYQLLGFLLLPPILAYVLGRYIPVEAQSFAAFAIPYITWIVAASAQNEVRNNLSQANIIKPMPLHGNNIIAAQVMSVWLTLFAIIGVLAVSMYVFMPDADHRLLGLLTVASLTGGLIAICAACISTLLYPDVRDKLQMIIPSLLFMLVVGIGLIPTIAITVIATLTEWNATVASAALLIINIAVSWGMISIAGYQFTKFDPTD